MAVQHAAWFVVYVSTIFYVVGFNFLLLDYSTHRQIKLRYMAGSEWS